MEQSAAACKEINVSVFLQQNYQSVKIRVISSRIIHQGGAVISVETDCWSIGGLCSKCRNGISCINIENNRTMR